MKTEQTEPATPAEASRTKGFTVMTRWGPRQHQPGCTCVPCRAQSKAGRSAVPPAKRQKVAVEASQQQTACSGAHGEAATSTTPPSSSKEGTPAKAAPAVQDVVQAALDNLSSEPAEGVWIQSRDGTWKQHRPGCSCLHCRKQQAQWRMMTQHAAAATLQSPLPIKVGRTGSEGTTVEWDTGPTGETHASATVIQPPALQRGIAGRQADQATAMPVSQQEAESPTSHSGPGQHSEGVDEQQLHATATSEPLPANCRVPQDGRAIAGARRQQQAEAQESVSIAAEECLRGETPASSQRSQLAPATNAISGEPRAGAQPDKVASVNKSLPRGSSLNSQPRQPGKRLRTAVGGSSRAAKLMERGASAEVPAQADHQPNSRAAHLNHASASLTIQAKPAKVQSKQAYN